MTGIFIHGKLTYQWDCTEKQLVNKDMSLLILPTEKKTTKTQKKRYPIQTKLQMYEGLD